MADDASVPEQPSGTVTLVFTDIEGSTRLLSELGQDAYRHALAEHREVVRAAFAGRGGYEVDYEGDSFFYAFASAADAVEAVREAMQRLEAGPIGLRVTKPEACAPFPCARTRPGARGQRPVGRGNRA